MIEFHLWDRKFHETSVIVRRKAHGYLAWWGFATFRTVHKRRVIYIMWHGKTKWIRSY